VLTHVLIERDFRPCHASAVRPNDADYLSSQSHSCGGLVCVLATQQEHSRHDRIGICQILPGSDKAIIYLAESRVPLRKINAIRLLVRMNHVQELREIIVAPLCHRQPIGNEEPKGKGRFDFWVDAKRCGADDRNRTGMGLHPTDFHTTSAFAAAVGVRGLDYPFAMLR